LCREGAKGGRRGLGGADPVVIVAAMLKGLDADQKPIFFAISAPMPSATRPATTMA
jgi:hypothetical protein